MPALSTLPLPDLFDVFIRECNDGTLRRRSVATIANYRSALQLLRLRTRVADLHQISVPVLRQFLNPDGAHDARKTATFESYRKNLSPFFNWCVSHQLIDSNPLLQIPRQRVYADTPEHYQPEELERILYRVSTDAHTAFERSRNTALLSTLILAGLRRGELLALQMSDIDLVSSAIRVRAGTAKNRVARVVAMAPTLRDILVDYLIARKQRGVDSPYLWLSSNQAMRFTVNGLKHLVDNLSRRLGFRIKPHKMRHTFATRFYQGSRDILSLRDILGHQNINTTTIYAHVLPEMTIEALKRSPLNNLFPSRSVRRT